ncbi:MAG: hypothetical protein QM704_21305 [Anaeromyxobacteraceae bacterium]
MASFPQTLATTGRNAAPALVLATALVATGLSYLSARSVADVQVARRFEDIGEGATGALRQRMDAYLLMLRSLAGLSNALDRAPTRAEFRAQYEALEAASHFPGIQGLGWVTLLSPGSSRRTSARCGPPGSRATGSGPPARAR